MKKVKAEVKKFSFEETFDVDDEAVKLRDKLNHAVKGAIEDLMESNIYPIGPMTVIDTTGYSKNLIGGESIKIIGSRIGEKFEVMLLGVVTRDDGISFGFRIGLDKKEECELYSGIGTFVSAIVNSLDVRAVAMEVNNYVKNSKSSPKPPKKTKPVPATEEPTQHYHPEWGSF